MWPKTAWYLLLVISVHCKEIKHRVPRFIGGTYTSTVTSTKMITSLVPSSCVYVDPTLQPCRSVRFLNFPQFDTIREYFNNKSSPFRARSDKTETTQLGWGEYLGIYQPTVTVTEIELQTAIVQDPRVAVTYAVKGCRPLKLPNDIDRCEIQAPSTIPILEILPTSTVAVPQMSALHSNGGTNNSSDSKSGQSGGILWKLNATDKIQTPTPTLESSTTPIEDNTRETVQRPTEPLLL
ncbi:uncharacterized protein LOC126890386 [Diabrotica virgifera virgifera]|uniref:Uncharacterized protein LOC114345559 isoform X2 n=1 Tax=Diabrotica virgifera virgifera TaxID=50390 RepID=A0A6P7H134_DIAVI|nr:uncharacterized protein LOC126890386 [Diabrotica virgifera virgifera]